MTPKNGVDRLKAARVAQVETNKQIAKLEAERRDALLADDDNRAATLDDELAALRSLAQRHLDKIALLGPAIEREEQERRSPHNLIGARERVAELLLRQDFLTRSNKREPSAAGDNEFQSNLGQIDILQKRIAIMERMQ